MPVRHAAYLERAHGALSRKDFLTAVQLGLRAAYAPPGQEVLRCEAHLVLALASLEMGAAEAALTFAVGAHLWACRSGDPGREERASGVVALVLAACPQLDGGWGKRAIH